MAKHRDVAYQSILVGGKKYTSLSTHEVTEVFCVLKKQQLIHFTLAVIQAPMPGFTCHSMVLEVLCIMLVNMSL